MDNRLMPYDDWIFVGEFIEKATWRFAKTYADTYPHNYVVKKDCNLEDYSRFYRLIRRYGYYYTFFNKKYIQLNVNEHYYWTMGWPSTESEVINRKERRIDALSNQGLKAPFDIVSDAEVKGDESDRLVIAEMIRQHIGNGRVLEIGCGSGLMTKLLDLDRESYLGIDPSWTLIEEFRSKQSNLVAWHTDFESVNVKGKDDFIFAACGSASYVRPEYWERLENMLSEGGRYFLTLYTSGYAKSIETVWKAGGVHFYSDDIPELMGETKRAEIGEYTIIEGQVRGV